LFSPLSGVPDSSSYRRTLSFLFDGKLFPAWSAFLSSIFLLEPPPPPSFDDLFFFEQARRPCALRPSFAETFRLYDYAYLYPGVSFSRFPLGRRSLRGGVANFQRVISPPHVLFASLCFPLLVKAELHLPAAFVRRIYHVPPFIFFPYISRVLWFQIVFYKNYPAVRCSFLMHAGKVLSTLTSFKPVFLLHLESPLSPPFVFRGMSAVSFFYGGRSAPFSLLRIFFLSRAFAASPIFSLLLAVDAVQICSKSSPS